MRRRSAYLTGWASSRSGRRSWPRAVGPVRIAHRVPQRLANRAPRLIIQINQMPRNANGKLVRAELPRFAAEQQP